jgi:hypothetical protein
MPSVFHVNLILTWSITQCPPLEAFSSTISATISWPCPKDTLWNFPKSIVNPSFLPVGEIQQGESKCQQRKGEEILEFSDMHLWSQLPSSRSLSWRSQTKQRLFPQAAFWALLGGLPASISIRKACRSQFLWFYDNEAFDILIDGGIVRELSKLLQEKQSISLIKRSNMW